MSLRTKIFGGILILGSLFVGSFAGAQTDTSGCYKQMYWQLATAPYSATGVGNVDGEVIGYPYLGPWHRSSDPQYTTNNTPGATTFDHYLRIKAQGDTDYGPWEMEECTTGSANGDKCTVPTLVRKPLIKDSTECGFEAGGAFSPPNRIDDDAPTCGASWSAYDASGNTTLSGSSDVLSGLADSNNYTCNAAAGANCSITIYDNAGNKAVCSAPSRPAATTKTPTCTASPSVASLDSNGKASIAFTAADGNGSFDWTALTGNPSPSSGAGQNFTTTYSTAGTQTVKVSSGGQFNTCDVQINTFKGHAAGCTDPNIITVNSNVPATWEVDGTTSGDSYKQVAPATHADYDVGSWETYGIIAFAADGSWPTSVVADPANQTISKCGQGITFTLTFNTPKQPPTNTNVTVTSNLDTTWVLSGPTPESGSGTRADYSVNPGTYFISPDPKAGYYIVVNDASDAGPANMQSVASGGSITFQILYVPYTSTCDPTFTIDPPSKSVQVGQNTTPDYKAWYDPDGPDCSAVSQNVALGSTWSISNATIATNNGGGLFTGLKVGSANVMASYAGLSASAILNVTAPAGTPDFACALSKNPITVMQGQSDFGSITCSPLNGFNSPITFSSQSGVPAATTLNYAPNPITIPTQSQYTFSAGPSSVPGSYPIVISATGGGITHLLNLTVIINTIIDPTAHYTCSNNTCTKVIGAGANSGGCNDLNVGSSCSTGGNTHAECVANACVQVANSQGNTADRCASDASCGGGGGGGGGPIHGICNAAQKVCANAAGAGANTCSTDPACGGGAGESHLACEGNACVIIGGPGSNENGCTAIGQSCSDTQTGGTCTLKANPSVIKSGDKSSLTWSCGGTITSCTIVGTGISGGKSGSGQVAPKLTTQYTLNCNSGAATALTTVYVVQSYNETNPH